MRGNNHASKTWLLEYKNQLTSNFALQAKHTANVFSSISELLVGETSHEKIKILVQISQEYWNVSWLFLFYHINLNKSRKLLTKSIYSYIIVIEKGKTSNGYAKKNKVIKITLLALVGWRYFFMEITSSNRTIIKHIMYSFPISYHLLSWRWWHNRPAFTLF